MSLRARAMTSLSWPSTKVWATSSPIFALALSAWLALAYNGVLFARLIEIGGGWDDVDRGFLIAVAISLWAAVHAVLCLATWPYIGKTVATMLVIAGASASYVTQTYGVLIDVSVIQSVAQTDRREVFELLNLTLAAHAVAYVIAPLVLIAAWPVAWASPAREIVYRISGSAISLLVLYGVATLYYADFASATRNHRELRMMVAPLNVVRASGKYLLHGRLLEPKEMQPIGLDARIREGIQTHAKPVLLVLVVGETARADHFSLLGYERDTNPRLRQQDALWPLEARSCGTSTAVSLPCMFSDLGRKGFGASAGTPREGLLHVLARAGYRVTWLDNNSGCKGACDGLTTETFTSAAVAGLCSEGQCLDEVLLEGLQARVDALQGNSVLVLHQKGNHGPAYFRRYPPTFERFTPACHSQDLARCERTAIVNAYDNAILYTDHVLASTIELLKQNQSRFHTAMMYVSDHGESLGEKNIYLHGMPYLIAPDAQVRIPMLLWLPSEFAEAHELNVTCLGQRREQLPSHDNVFHTVIGLAGVTTAVYRRELDLLSRCTWWSDI